jgi:type IV pilus assembly protein PilA
MHTRARSRGFTLVELMITVAIIGVLAALATLGISKYMHLANASEARSFVGAIARSAALAFESERAQSQIVGEGSNAASASNQLCETATPVPATFTNVKGRKYQPNTAEGKDFETGNGITGWKCLRFGTSQPIYYQYQYNKNSYPISSAETGAPLPGANGFEAVALGDLDGDGTSAVFIRAGTVNALGVLIMSTHVFAARESE